MSPAMTIDEKAFEATEALYPWGRVAIRTAEDRKLILAYEAAKPVPASGGAEAVREALFEEALVGHFGTSNTTTFTAREAGRQAAIVVRDLFAALASSTPAEAEPAAYPATMEGVRVKPLEWLSHVWGSEADGGRYRIEDNGTNWTDDRYWLFVNVGLLSNHRSKHSTLAEAKAAAQTHYEARILSALSPEAKERSNG